MLFDHFNTDLIYNILFSKLQIPQSFVYEKLNFIETKIISRKNKISKLKNFKTFIFNDLVSDFTDLVSGQNYFCDNIFVPTTIHILF